MFLFLRSVQTRQHQAQRHNGTSGNSDRSSALVPSLERLSVRLCVVCADRCAGLRSVLAHIFFGV